MLRFVCFVVATVALTAALPVPMAGQAPTAAVSTWDPPRHPDGQPNVEGVWANTERARAMPVWN